MENITSRMISQKRRASGTKISGIIFLLVCVLILVSCNILSGTTPTNGTDILEELQKEVPFTIIIPKYLPADISPYPTGILGPAQGANSDNSVAVGFGYSKDGSNTKFIDIYEESGEVIFHPSKPSSVYLKIRGVQVLEEGSAVVIPSSSGNTMVRGYFYGWNLNGVNFKITIYGYTLDEGRRVVESMIK